MALSAFLSSDRVPFAQDGAEPAGDHAQHAVAEAVTEGVVDDLEAVQVEEHHHQRGLLAPGVGQCDGQPVAEEEPVRQPGQRVVVSLILDLLLGPPALADVARDRDDLRHLAIRIEDGPAGGLEPDERAVLLQGPIAEGVSRRIRNDGAQHGAVFGMDEGADR
jgi:hypothetical protein